MLNIGKHHAGNLEQFLHIRLVLSKIKSFGGQTNMKECQNGFWSGFRAVPTYSATM